MDKETSLTSHLCASIRKALDAPSLLYSNICFCQKSSMTLEGDSHYSVFLGVCVWGGGGGGDGGISRGFAPSEMGYDQFTSHNAGQSQYKACPPQF